MFVFPAFDANFKKRKRTFKCCSHCRQKRVKCELIENFEVNGCKNCRRLKLDCNLVVETTHDKQNKQKLQTEGIVSTTKAQSEDDDSALQFNVKRPKSSKTSTHLHPEQLNTSLPQNNISNICHNQMTGMSHGEYSKKSRSLQQNSTKLESRDALNHNVQVEIKEEDDDDDDEDDDDDDLSSIVFNDFQPGEIQFVNTWDSLIKILNLPSTKKNGNVEIKKSNSVTTFQATYSKYVGSTDPTALFIQQASPQQNKCRKLLTPITEKKSFIDDNGGSNSSTIVSEATGDNIDSNSIAQSSNVPLSVSSNGSVDSEEFESKIPNYHSIAYKTAPSNSKVTKKGILQDMLGFFVKSNDNGRKSNWNDDALNYGPFTIPAPLYGYLESVHCFEIGISKITQYRLIKLYFKKFNNILPFLSEESSLTTFKNNHMPTLILYSLVLFSIRLEGSSAILKADGISDPDSFANKLENKVRTMLKFNLDENRLTLLRTHTLLSLYGGGSTGSNGSLELFSMDLSIAIHHAYTLGIQHNHYSLSQQDHIGKKDTTTSKLFWCLFILDRLNGLVNSRNCTINRKDSSLGLPIDKHLNGLVQAVIRLEKVIISYQPRGDSRSIPKDIDFDIGSNPIYADCSNVASECLRRLIVNITIMIAQKRKYDQLDKGKENYQSMKSIPDEIYSKSALQVLNLVSNYLHILPIINFIPYCVSYTLSCFVKLGIKSIKNDMVNGIQCSPKIKEWTCEEVLRFLSELKNTYWYADETYKICTEYLRQKGITFAEDPTTGLSTLHDSRASSSKLPALLPSVGIQSPSSSLFSTPDNPKIRLPSLSSSQTKQKESSRSLTPQAPNSQNALIFSNNVLNSPLMPTTVPSLSSILTTTTNTPLSTNTMQTGLDMVSNSINNVDCASSSNEPFDEIPDDEQLLSLFNDLPNIQQFFWS